MTGIWIESQLQPSLVGIMANLYIGFQIKLSLVVMISCRSACIDLL